jgi:hypothetical protein
VALFQHAKAAVIEIIAEDGGVVKKQSLYLLRSLNQANQGGGRCVPETESTWTAQFGLAVRKPVQSTNVMTGGAASEQTSLDWVKSSGTISRMMN